MAPSSDTHPEAWSGSDDDVRRRAYEIFEERSRVGRSASPLDDWAQAEREVRGARRRRRNS